MKKSLLLLLIIIIASCAAPKKCCGQTDSLELYKKGYQIAKTLNVEYKQKIDLQFTTINEQDSLILDLRNLLSTKDLIIKYDSEQIDILNQQQVFLKDNLSIYQKEFNKRDKFWNKPWFGAVLGAVGTITIIHVIDYSLPQ
jgi:hypothetical protein